MNLQLAQLIAGYEIVVAAESDQKVKDALIDGIKSHEAILESAVERLTPILEDMSNYLNGCNAVTKLDERILGPGNEVVLLGMDELENDYQKD